MILNLNWTKGEGLIPAVIQDSETSQVLMLGYMNEESFRLTQETGQVTFFSRTRQSIWRKGETSGHSLTVVDINADCDQDALLIRVKPQGPVCHRNTPTCFDHEYEFLNELTQVIESRIKESSENSYVSRLVQSGIDRVIQKVGEEAIETVIAAKNSDGPAFENEAADLLFHLMVLLQVKNHFKNNPLRSFARIVQVLKERHLNTPRK